MNSESILTWFLGIPANTFFLLALVFLAVVVVLYAQSWLYRRFEAEAIRYGGVDAVNAKRKAETDPASLHKALRKALEIERPMKLGEGVSEIIEWIQEEKPLGSSFEELFTCIFFFNQFIDALRRGDRKALRYAANEINTLRTLAQKLAHLQGTETIVGKQLKQWTQDVHTWMVCAEYLLPKLDREIKKEESKRRPSK